jgi:hypothetical protein
MGKNKGKKVSAVSCALSLSLALALARPAVRPSSLRQSFPPSPSPSRGQREGDKGSVWQPPKEEAEDDDDEETEDVTKGVASMGVGGGGAAAAPSAPFSFTPAPKGQSPFGAGGTAAPIFSFPGGAGGATAGAATPNFSFDFAAQKPKAEKKEDGEEGDDDEEDDEDDEDPVEEFIKSLPEPVQKCVSALDTLDEEICDLETQFRKDLRDLERKVTACSPCFGALRRMCGHERVVSLRSGRAS